jgi:hypothetical protein
MTCHPEFGSSGAAMVGKDINASSELLMTVILSPPDFCKNGP